MANLDCKHCYIYPSASKILTQIYGNLYKFSISISKYLKIPCGNSPVKISGPENLMVKALSLGNNGMFYKGQFKNGMRHGKGEWKEEIEGKLSTYNGDYYKDK
jgi:hypothetical protein